MLLIRIFIPSNSFFVNFIYVSNNFYILLISCNKDLEKTIIFKIDHLMKNYYFSHPPFI